MKSFTASQAAIKEMIIEGNSIYVAGCDPIIRDFNIIDGDRGEFLGHSGWVYCLVVHRGKLYSGGDDQIVRIWNLETRNQVETLISHKNGITALVLCNDMLVSCGYDKSVITWDIDAAEMRIIEKELMFQEDLNSHAERRKNKQEEDER